MHTFVRLLLGFILALALFTPPAHAEVNEIRIAKQPGLGYLQMIVMEENKLIEKQAKARGLGDVKISWITFNSGGTSTDALLSGNLDIVASGATNMLLLWSKTNGQVKGLAGGAALPMKLLTRNPAVKSLADFTGADKIAVPTVRVSSQAVMLSAAEEKAFGEAGMHKLDPMTVALGHPDALIALQSGKGEVDSHFSLPPYQDVESSLPGVHVVLNSYDVWNAPVSNIITQTTTKFHDANPKLIAAFIAANNEAIDLINKDKKTVAEIYLRATGEKFTLDQLVAIMSQPHFLFSTAPQNTMRLAEVMYRGGILKDKPANWKDYFFPEVYASAGS